MWYRTLRFARTWLTCTWMLGACGEDSAGHASPIGGSALPTPTPPAATSSPAPAMNVPAAQPETAPGMAADSAPPAPSSAKPGASDSTNGSQPTTNPAMQPAMHDRDGLIDLMERYLDALIAHDPAAIDVTANVKVTENGVAMKFGEGLFQTAQSIQFRQFFADPSAQQVGFFGTLATSDGPAMLALRLKLDDGVVSEAEAIVPRQGGHALFAPDALVEPMPIYDMLLSAAEPAPRDELLAIANRYFDAIEQADGQVAPFHPECNRRENGVQTTNNPARNFPLGCEEGINSLTYIPRVRDRRFPVVDEERGLVWAFVMFDMPSQNRSMRLSELFKIVDGGIREIEALMINTPLDASTGWNE